MGFVEKVYLAEKSPIPSCVLGDKIVLLGQHFICQMFVQLYQSVIQNMTLIRVADLLFF